MKQMNALQLKQALQEALEKLESLPANMPVTLCGKDGLEPLETFSVYLTNSEGNEAEGEESVIGVTIIVD
ncbi:hypothetical protein D3C80_1037580 [compost metagenome]